MSTNTTTNSNGVESFVDHAGADVIAFESQTGRHIVACGNLSMSFTEAQAEILLDYLVDRLGTPEADQ